MSQSQLRVKLVVAAGVVGASLLAATLVGCQSNPTSQAQSGPYGQYNGNQFAGAQNGQQQYMGNPQMASAGAPANDLSPQGQQAFLNETQRLGTQQNLSAQDVVAMARSGVPDQQIAMAVQQRGAALRATPGMSQYLAQSGVNPNVLGLGPIGGGVQTGGPAPAGAFGGQLAMNDQQTAFGANMSQARPMVNPAQTSGVMPAGYPAAQADQGQMQSATAADPSLSSPALDPSNGGMNGQSWRAMPH